MTSVTQPCALHFGHCGGTGNVSVAFSVVTLQTRVSASVAGRINDGNWPLPFRAPTDLRSGSAVPNTKRPLPIPCPKCEHVGSILRVKSMTVMMVTCAGCGHTWATEMSSLPPEVQAKIPDALRDL